MNRLLPWLLPLLLASLFVGLRLAHPLADPPTKYPNGVSSFELVVEGPAKAHEARRYGLFGSFVTKEADNYRIWSVQSPSYVMPLAGFFRLFGTGYLQLRIFCALAAGLGLLAYFGLGRQHGNRLVGPMACVLFAVSFFDIQLTRGALLEPYLNALLALAFLAGVLSLRSLPWLMLCELAFAAALLTKQTALFAFPALLGLGVLALLRAKQRGAPRWQYGATLGLGVALAAGLLFYVLSPAYWRTLQWNFGHMIVGVEAHRQPTMTAVKVAAILARLTDGERWLNCFLYIAPLAPLALLQIGRTIVAAVRRRPVETVDVVAGAWLVLAVVALQLTDQHLARFFVIVVPPAALLAASFLAGALAWRPRPVGWAVVAAAAAVVISTDARWQWRWYSAPTYDMRTATRILNRELGSDSVLLGAWAPAIGFGTKADLFYIKGPFNWSRYVIEQMGATHLLERKRKDWSARRIAKVFPDAYASKESLGPVRLMGYPLEFFRLTEPLRVQQPVSPRPALPAASAAPR